MRIIIDTGVLWKRSVIELLIEMGDELVIPAVAFTERARQVRKQGWSEVEFKRRLDAWGFIIEPFGVEESTRFATALVDDACWISNARDAMIAGHIRPGDQLWTTNPRDFLEIGVPPQQLMVVPG